MSVREIKNGQKKKIAGLVTPQTADKNNYGIVKLSDSENIFDSNAGFVLSASEKNARVSGSLAQQIGSNRTNIATIFGLDGVKMFKDGVLPGIKNLDANTIDRNHIYKFDNDDYNACHTPCHYGYIYTDIWDDNDYATQYIIPINGPRTVYIRQKNSGVWDETWTELAKKEVITEQHTSKYGDTFTFSKSGNVAVVTCDNENSIGFEWQALFAVSDNFKPNANYSTILYNGTSIGIFADGNFGMLMPEGNVRRIVFTYITAN